jgi:glycerophosphoryl diester phosphodiesterase
MIRQLHAALAFAAALLTPIAATAGAPAGGFAALRERVLHPPPGHVVVVAHRACFAAAPENSPEAIDACARLGVEVVENDVRSTKDGELVLMHDDTVNRTTNGWGYLNDLTLADLAKLRLRDGEGGPGAAVTTIPVTTLRAYYRAAKGKVMINLELKPSLAADFPTLLEKSLKIAAEEGVLEQILLKVPDQMSHGKLASKHILSTIAPPAGVTLWPIIWEGPADPIRRVDELEPYGGNGYELPFITADYFKRIAADPRLKGRPVMAVAVQPQWSGGLSDQVSMADPEAGWGKLLSLGANVIMTDHPEYLLRYLEKTGRRRATPR